MPLRLSGAAAPFSCNVDYGSLDPRPDDANGDNLEALEDGKQHSQALLEQSDFSVRRTRDAFQEALEDSPGQAISIGRIISQAASGCSVDLG